MKIMKKSIILIVVFTLLLSETVAASPDILYGSGYVPYTYNYKSEIVATPAAYVPFKTLTGFDVGGMPFNNISDITYDKKNRIYLADSGNNRIVITDKNFNVVKIVHSYLYENKVVAFNNPTCVAYADDKYYVSDSLNGRIIVFNANNNTLLKVFEKPSIALLKENYSYQPIKITVDYAGRIYVIAKDINQGLIQLDQNGVFMNFMGAPKVTPDFELLLLKRLFPKATRDTLIKTVPTEYNSVIIDDKGFLFVTSQSSNIPPIARLNGQGANVLKAVYEYPNGDGFYVDENGVKLSSMFVDVYPRADGGYFALDAKRGRVFCYDVQGTLLYIFGYIGSQKGSFYSPTAIEYVDNNIVVIDKGQENINLYKPTKFGQKVDEAVILHNKGDYLNEATAWENVLKLCSNYDTANINLARIDIQNANNIKAMERLYTIGEKKYYSIAFKNYRSQEARKYFYVIFALSFLLVLSLLIVPRLLKRSAAYQKMTSKKLFKDLKYGLYVMLHPFDGFWDLKREKKGSLNGALCLLSLFIIFYAIRAKFTGYLFMNKSFNSINILFEVAMILIPLLLWIISNWCFTSLMSGEGSFKDIFIASCYALTPYIVLSPLLFIMSHIFTMEEAAFYIYFNVFSISWVVFLVFIGMMETHDYSFGKSLITIILTIIGICLLVFIALLFSNLINEIYIYFYNIYKEISFRFY